jgi:hypothetical protein
MDPNILPEIKRPGHEAEHSPPSSSVVKNKWRNMSISSERLHGVYRDSLSILQKNVINHNNVLKKFIDRINSSTLLFLKRHGTINVQGEMTVKLHAFLIL